MNPQQLQDWLATEGGLLSVEGPNANGDTTYWAKSGQLVTLRQDGSLAVRGYRPPSAPAAAADAQGGGEAAPAAPTSGGRGLSEQDVLGQLAQIAPGGDPGGLKYTETSRIATVTDTSGVVPRAVRKQVPVSIWYDPATGQAMKFD